MVLLAVATVGLGVVGFALAVRLAGGVNAWLQAFLRRLRGPGWGFGYLLKDRVFNDEAFTTAIRSVAGFLTAGADEAYGC